MRHVDVKSRSEIQQPFLSLIYLAHIGLLHMSRSDEKNDTIADQIYYATKPPLPHRKWPKVLARPEEQSLRKGFSILLFSKCPKSFS